MREDLIDAWFGEFETIVRKGRGDSDVALPVHKRVG